MPFIKNVILNNQQNIGGLKQVKLSAHKMSCASLLNAQLILYAGKLSFMRNLKIASEITSTHETSPLRYDLQLTLYNLKVYLYDFQIIIKYI